MTHFIRFASTAPVVATVWFVITAGLLIEFNRFYPDLLSFNVRVDKNY